MGQKEEETDEIEQRRHIVRLSLDKGWAVWTMECPYDGADPARPCWPCEENSERMDPASPGAMECNWAEWWHEGGDVEQVWEAPEVTMPVTDADWMGDHYRFFLGAPLSGR